MRSAVWFVVAGLIALVSLAGAWLYLMPRLAAANAEMVRVVVPGDVVLMLDKPGDYTIFHEKNSMVDGRYYGSDSVARLSLALTAETTGTPVKLVEPTGSSSYTLGNPPRHLDPCLHPRPGRPLSAGVAPGGRSP